MHLTSYLDIIIENNPELNYFGNEFKSFERKQFQIVRTPFYIVKIIDCFSPQYIHLVKGI